MLSEPLILNVETVHLSDEQFYQFCMANRDLRVEKFPPIAPDFVFELRWSPTGLQPSRSDAIAPLREKMEEYLACGVQLGWLFNPQEQQVEIYRQGHPPEVRSLPTNLSGEDVLPGFQLFVEPFTD